MTAPLQARHYGEMSEGGVPRSVRRSRLKPVRGAFRYVRGARERCFICAVVQRDPEYFHHIVYEDEFAIGFLDKSPRLWGTVLVSPKEHREQVTGDFASDEYVRLQRVVFAIGEAIRQTVPCERLYVLSLGSQQMNRHVHWHVAPLPPGVPLHRQQLRAFSELLAGNLYGPAEEFARLAARIGEKVVVSDRNL